MNLVSLSLRMRRLHSDLILVFKIMKGCVYVDAKFFQFLEDPYTRGYILQICEHIGFLIGFHYGLPKYQCG